MVDEGLKQRMMELVAEGSIGVDNIQDYLNLLVQISNESEEIKEECEGWARTLLFSIEGYKYLWLSISEDAEFELGEGKLDNPDVILEMNAEVAASVFSGDIDATQAYMRNDLKIIGPIPDALKFRTLTEIVRDELKE